MNYLQYNKVNYLQDNQPVLIYNDSSNSLTSYNSCSYIIYSDNNVNSNITYIDLNPLLRDDNTLVNKTFNSYVGTLMYAIIPSFTNSDITSITSNDSITFTVTINDNVTTMCTYVFPVQPLYVNTFAVNNHLQFNDVLTSFKVKYESTCKLTYIPTKFNNDETTIASLVFL